MSEDLNLQLTGIIALVVSIIGLWVAALTSTNPNVIGFMAIIVALAGIVAGELRGEQYD